MGKRRTRILVGEPAPRVRWRRRGGHLTVSVFAWMSIAVMSGVAQAGPTGRVEVVGPADRISAGQFHTCGLRVDATVSCWGSNGAGESMPPSGTFTAVSAGGSHSCGLRPGGTVSCWGHNLNGESAPPSGSFTAVSAGGDHSCGLRPDGTVSCWGSNVHGESAPPAGSFAAVSAGLSHSCGVRTDATVSCWGHNNAAQASPPPGSFTSVSAGGYLSCGVRTDQSVACWGLNSGFGALNPPLALFVSVSTGDAHSCGVRVDGTVSCWGANLIGESTPPSGEFFAVSVGGRHSCGMRIDRSVACWGDGFYGQAAPPAGSFTTVSAGGPHACGLRVDLTVSCWGNSSTGQSTPPALLFTAVSAGEYHSCGLRTDATVSCWGDSLFGQTTPPTGLFTAVSAGGSHSCGLRTSGAVSCWGANLDGQTNAPAGLFSAVSAGGSHSCGVRTDGSVLCWGADEAGQSTTPTGSFADVSAGGRHSCGVRSDGTVSCWGANFSGESTAPAGTFTAVSAGGEHTCGLRSDGSMSCWGNNVFGRSTPPAGSFSVVSAGLNHSCGVRTDGVFQCWGSMVALGDPLGSRSTTGLYVPMVPARVMETRLGEAPTVDGFYSGFGLRPAGSVTDVQIAGRAGVPDDAGSVVLNVTVTGAQAPGFVTVWPCGATRPTASNLNFEAGSTIPNAVITKVGVGGNVCIFTSATTHLVVDLNGYHPAGAAYVPVVPARLMESRPGEAPTVDGLSSGIGLRGAGSVTELPISGRAGIPDDAGSVVLNVTVTGAQAPGFVTVWPCGATRPTASNLNFEKGSTIPNAVIAKVGVGGRVCLFASAATHLVVDLNGYNPAGAPYVPVVPARLLESRPGEATTVDGQSSGIGLRAAGSVTALQITGRAGLASSAAGVNRDVGSVVLNVTVTGAQAPGFVTVWPCGTTRPTASNLNFEKGSTIPNAVIAKLSDAGDVCLFTSAPTHLIVDLNGYNPM